MAGAVNELKSQLRAHNVEVITYTTDLVEEMYELEFLDNGEGGDCDTG